MIEQGHLLDCDYRVCMDFEYFVRLASAGFKFHYVPQFIAAFRWHESNISLQQAERRAFERQEVQRRFGTCERSDMQMTMLRQGYRAKRVLRKIVSGNAKRELLILGQCGEKTLWMRDVEAMKTCAKLACL